MSSSTSPKKRIVLVDALRGYALMGLFLIHMVEYFEVYWYKPEPSMYNDAMFFLFGGKSYAIFALLFGLSFFLIMDGQRKKGIDFRGRFAWRICLLFFMGVFHSLIYGGDILHVLALSGFMLVPIYKAKNYLLLILSGFFLLQSPSLIYYFILISEGKTFAESPSFHALMAQVHSIYANGSFGKVLDTNVGIGLTAKWTFLLETGRFSTIIGMSFLGFWLGKIDFFKEEKIKHNKYLIGFVVSLLLAIVVFPSRSYLVSLNPQKYWIINAIIKSYADLTFIAATVFAFILLYRIKGIKETFGLMAAPGRMSLTIYVLQSILFVPVFYGFGMAAYTFLGQTLSFWLGVVFWVAQVWFARWWIERYYYGPMEWLWRSATYLRNDIVFKREEKRSLVLVSK